MDDLVTMLPFLEQGKALFCPVLHAYLSPLGNGEVRRTQYLMESEWAEPRILRIDELREQGIREYAKAKKQHAEYLRMKDELKKSDLVLPFGKHKGKHFSEVPKDYIEWLAQQKWENSAFPDTANYYLQEKTFIEDVVGMCDEDSDFSYDWELDES